MVYIQCTISRCRSNTCPQIKIPFQDVDTVFIACIGRILHANCAQQVAAPGGLQQTNREEWCSIGGSAFGGCATSWNPRHTRKVGKTMPELAKSWSPRHTRKVGKTMPELAKRQEPQTHQKSRQNYARAGQKLEPQTHQKSRQNYARAGQKPEPQTHFWPA